MNGTNTVVCPSFAIANDWVNELHSLTLCARRTPSSHEKDLPNSISSWIVGVVWKTQSPQVGVFVFSGSSVSLASVRRE